MAIKGSLKEASLADVCQLLALGLKTGCLAVTDRARFGEIYFERGRITYARIVNRRDRLGDLLVRDGVVTHDQLEEALSAQERDPDRLLGRLLVERGLLDDAVLERYVRLQIEEAIFHLFTWSRGNFFFAAAHQPADIEIRVAIAAESMLLEAARRVDEWSLIESKVPSFELVFRANRDRLDHIAVELTETQRALIDLLDGERSLHAIVEETGVSEFEVGAAVFGLVQAGLAIETGRRVEQNGRDVEGGEQRNLGFAFLRAGMLEDAARAFRRVLELKPDDDEAQFQLAVIALREERHHDAVRKLRALLDAHGPRFEALVNLSLALRCLGRTRDALLVLDEAERVRPGAPEPPLARAAIRLDRQHIAQARRDLAEYRERVPDAAPVAPQYFYLSALACALLGETDRAWSVASEGVGANPESPPLLLIAGLIAERRGAGEEAERLYRRVTDLDPSLVQAQKSLGDVAFQRGAHDLALHRYQRAAEIAPDLGDDLYARLGDLHYRARNREGAIRYWRRALELNPKNHAVRNNLEIVAHVEH